MKKKIILALIMALLPIYAASAAKAHKKITVMVYMCGSNLESINGSASADIQEMIDAGINGNEVSLLVMTGGSEAWDMGFDNSQILIHEISSKGRRIVWRTDTMSMGYHGTLTQLLTFGKSNYPSDQYALILWDHGGGPLEGVCWDELFSMDHLTLSELSRGIQNADMGQKLSWIGFDACLMSSIEVAAAISPYSEFMIASQETEPSTGWNYSFLSEIEKDVNGADTGRRIIDAYFKGQEDSRDILTMSCIDLAEISKLTDAITDLFEPYAESITADNFPDISAVRMTSRGFGESYRASGEDGYDLVDAYELLTHLFPEGSNSDDSLIKKFNSAVIHNRANENGANGLSLYHPYVNKNGFLSGWRDDYEKLKFSSSYSQYIKSFGTLLTGEDLVDWHGLEIHDDGLDDENHIIQFSLQLSPEQAAHFASAQLVILEKTGDVRYMDNDHSEYQNEYHKIYVTQAAIKENNQIIGTYDGKALYLEYADGSLDGPMSFEQSRDRSVNVLLGAYSKEVWPQNDLQVDFIFENAGSDTYPEIIQRRVVDAVTNTDTNRITYSENDYHYLSIVFMQRYFTEDPETHILPRYNNWEINNNSIMMVVVELPNQWRLRYDDNSLLGSPDLYAMFEITDLQQNVYSCPPIPFRNPNLADSEVVTPVTPNKGLDNSSTEPQNLNTGENKLMKKRK